VFVCLCCVVWVCCMCGVWVCECVCGVCVCVYPTTISQGQVRVKRVSIILIVFTEQLRYTANNRNNVKCMLCHFSQRNWQHSYRNNIFEE